MGKINVLDSAVFNRIAAGEVVENPCSVVKELLENSIDAGADSVTVEIRDGGLGCVCVSDNGKGLEREDMPTAFLPHATSKIRDLKDLESIATLGFRGEALPSIASVADVTMISRIEGNELGYKLELHGGKITQEGECGCPLGTKIAVSNLFANIPARLKFMRKPKAEEGSISEFVAKMILANPDLKIKYIADSDVIYQSYGNGVESAILSVYGQKFLNGLAPVKYSMPDITISGFIGRPEFTKHNRTYQTLIVNGRYIVNSEMSYCIQQCYFNYLMKRQFPVYVLFLTMPTDMVDVNVHPNKLDVRFSGEKRLKGIIYNLIKEKVDELALSPIEFVSVGMLDSEAGKILAEKETLAQTDIRNDKNDNFDVKPVLSEQKIISGTVHQNLGSAFFSAPLEMNEPSKIKAKLNDFAEVKFENKQIEPKEEIKVKDLFDGDSVDYVGKLFNTYLLVQSDDNFYVIDQHAAHEKLLYDKLVAQLEEQETVVQDLMVPYIFDVSPSEKVALAEILPKINEYGFKIDALSGNSFSLYGLPLYCTDIDLKKFVSILLEDIGNGKSGLAFIKESLMQAACKSAVKGHDDLSQSEIENLLNQMRASDSARFCPHGRPTVIKFNKYDLEKLFKRT